MPTVPEIRLVLWIRMGRDFTLQKNATEQFKRQFSATVQFMNKRGTSGDIAKLEASEDIYYIGPPERN